MRKISILFLIALLVHCSPALYACSTFTLQKDGHIVFGRNLDWHADSGLIIVNQRGVTKKALILPLSQREVNPAQWTSKYGSVTFNGLGREFPNGGMNEAGLVIDIMWLASTRYEKADSRPEISVMQWNQYLLDTCATVDEALASMSKIRISEDGIPPQHFLLGDRTGNTAVIDFINGKPCVYTGNKLPYTALTNSTYEDSVNYAKRHTGFGGNQAIPQGDGSLDRFVRVVKGLNDFSSQSNDIIKHSFNIMHSVNAGYELNQHSTVWSIVYDISGKKIYFRTNSNRDIRSIDTAKIDFSNRKPVHVWNVLNDMTGNITLNSMPYTKELNHKTIIKQITNKGVIESAGDLRAMIDPVSAYPEMFTSCKSE